MVKLTDRYKQDFTLLQTHWSLVSFALGYRGLTHWGRVTHICVGKLTIFGSDNGLSPGQRQAIIWTSAGILLIGPLGTNFSEILIKFKHFHSRKSIWKCRLRSGVHLSRPQCVNNILKNRVSIGSDNGLWPVQRQAIIETNAGLLSIVPIRTNFSEILVKMQNFSFTKIHLKISSVERQPFCPGGEELSWYLGSLQLKILLPTGNFLLTRAIGLLEQSSPGYIYAVLLFCRCCDGVAWSSLMISLVVCLSLRLVYVRVPYLFNMGGGLTNQDMGLGSYKAFLQKFMKIIEVKQRFLIILNAKSL